MSEAKFTKGPWSVRLNGAGFYDIGVSYRQEFVACHYNEYTQRSEDEAEANAYLIAAAPEMYEMLEALVDGDSINDSSIDLEVLSLLAKARGETK